MKFFFLNETEVKPQNYLKYKIYLLIESFIGSLINPNFINKKHFQNTVTH